MGEISFTPIYRCTKCSDIGWIWSPGRRTGLRRCDACRRSEESENLENRVVEVDGGALTPAECEAKMRTDRDRAMRIACGFEAAGSGKPPADPTTSTTASPDVEPTIAEIERAVAEANKVAKRSMDDWLTRMGGV